MPKKGDAIYQEQMARMDAQQAAEAKRGKILCLGLEKERASDPDIKAEIEREIEEIRASD